MKRNSIIGITVAAILVVIGIFVFGGGSQTANAPAQNSTATTQTARDMSIIPSNLNEVINQLITKIGQPGVYVIDVRTPQEWEAGHVDGAMLWGLANHLQKNEMPNIDKNAEIYVYCHSGNRAAQAARILQSAGFTDITNIGGFQNWVDAGGPVATGLN